MLRKKSSIAWNMFQFKQPRQVEKVTNIILTFYQARVTRPKKGSSEMGSSSHDNSIITFETYFPTAAA